MGPFRPSAASLLLPVVVLVGSACGGGAPPPVTGGEGGQGGQGGGLAMMDAAGGTGGAIPPDAAADLAAPPADTLVADQAPPVMDSALPEVAPAADATPDPAGAVTWVMDNTQRIGGHATTVVGAPTVIDTPEGKALQFDGNDALFIEHHPLARLSEFTVELVFRPDPGGVPAQRWFHMQDGASSGKVLFETRLPGGNSWVLDVFVESRAGEVALYDAKRTHPLGQWYHVAAVVDGKRMKHFVNGAMESDVALGFTPHGNGRTSIGVRITRMYFFKGAIRVARFTPRALTPAEFLK